MSVYVLPRIHTMTHIKIPDQFPCPFIRSFGGATQESWDSIAPVIVLCWKQVPNTSQRLFRKFDPTCNCHQF